MFAEIQCREEMLLEDTEAVVKHDEEFARWKSGVRHSR